MNPAIFAIVLSGINLIVAGIFFPVIRILLNFKRNDLHHIQETINLLNQRVCNLEKKIDSHIQWHLDKRGPRDEGPFP